jgi:hypothetical protein
MRLPALMKSPVIYLVEERDNSSSHFFIRPMLQASAHPVKRFSGAMPPMVAEDGVLVVFVRYISPAWRRWVNEHRRALGGVVFFMDDDLLDWRASEGQRWKYRWKLWRSATRHARWLRQQDAALWVSSPVLEKKYASWPVRLIPPSDIGAVPDTIMRVFYHGTASHHAEYEWLTGVMKRVMAEDPAIRFEIFGDANAREAWWDFPGVSVIHPMQWPAYFAFSALQGRAIGLAPLLNEPFNSARSYTKFFDITRSGAVGIYGNHPAFSAVVRDQLDGFLLNQEPEEWVDAILRLARDEGLRCRMLASARERVRDLNAQAKVKYLQLWQ